MSKEFPDKAQTQKESQQRVEVRTGNLERI